MKIKIYHNENFLRRWDEDYERKLKMVYEFEISETIPHKFTHKETVPILEWCFHEFNVGDGPKAKEYRGKRLRSLSAGDVVVVGETAWSCESVGWERITTDDLRAGIVRGEAA